jgi:hypothetical protein
MPCAGTLFDSKQQSRDINLQIAAWKFFGYLVLRCFLIIDKECKPGVFLNMYLDL